MGGVIAATLVSAILTHLRHLPGGWVYALVALLVFGEAAVFIGFVLPGETSVLVAGVVASQGRVNIGVLCGLVALSAILGDSVGYIVGREYGHQLLRLPILRHRRAALDRSLEGLNRRGPIYVFIGRFTAFLRAVMPGLAGMSRMHYRRFFIANAAGGIVWGVGFTLLGYYAGTALSRIERYASWAGITLLVVVLVLAVGLHLRRRARERREEN
jgi:membrane-associated protein